MVVACYGNENICYDIEEEVIGTHTYYIVNYCGDEVTFTSIEEAKKFIEEIL